MDSTSFSLTPRPEPADADREIFRFFDLPAELRVIIYEFCLLPDDKTNLQLTPSNKCLAPHLLRVCRQIHQEGEDALYKNKTITVTASLCSVNALKNLSHKARSLIKRVRVEMSASSDSEEFSLVMRYGLRYCSGLRTGTVILKLPVDFDQSPSEMAYFGLGKGRLLSVKWLPQTCNILLEDGASEWARNLVEEAKKNMATMSAKEYAQWQVRADRGP